MKKLKLIPNSIKFFWYVIYRQSLSRNLMFLSKAISIEFQKFRVKKRMIKDDYPRNPFKFSKYAKRCWKIPANLEISYHLHWKWHRIIKTIHSRLFHVDQTKLVVSIIFIRISCKILDVFHQKHLEIDRSSFGHDWNIIFLERDCP